MQPTAYFAAVVPPPPHLMFYPSKCSLQFSSSPSPRLLLDRLSLPTLTSLLSLSCVMLVPCPSCLPSLTCLRTAAMKSLRRRRILRGFSLGPGTSLHGVRVFACACLLSRGLLHAPAGLATNRAQAHCGGVVRN